MRIIEFRSSFNSLRAGIASPASYRLSNIKNGQETEAVNRGLS